MLFLRSGARECSPSVPEPPERGTPAVRPPRAVVNVAEPRTWRCAFVHSPWPSASGPGQCPAASGFLQDVSVRKAAVCLRTREGACGCTSAQLAGVGIIAEPHPVRLCRAAGVLTARHVVRCRAGRRMALPSQLHFLDQNNINVVVLKLPYCPYVVGSGQL